jgi:hypothetical protein
MKVLVGDTRSRRIVRQLEAAGWGRMCLRDKPDPYDGEPWGYDNGAFVAWVSGKPWDGDAYLRRLERAYTKGRPMLAVTPDRVADPSSLEFSLSWLERLPADWPWYLAVQDGMVPGRVDLAPFSGVFLGGSNRYKGTAPAWRAAAHAAGLPFHYGRAGTLRKLEHARQAGADSIDSAFPLWSVDRLQLFMQQWRDGSPQMWLPMEVLSAATG